MVRHGMENGGGGGDHRTRQAVPTVFSLWQLVFWVGCVPVINS